jgi:hypothetical protein
MRLVLEIFPSFCYKRTRNLFETLTKMLTIFGVCIVLFFLKLLNGNRNLVNILFQFLQDFCQPETS